MHIKFKLILGTYWPGATQPTSTSKLESPSKVTAGGGAPVAGKKRVASPAVNVTSPPVVQDLKKGRVEPEQEPIQVEDMQTPAAKTTVDSDQEGYSPTPVRSLSAALDAAATESPTPRRAPTLDLDGTVRGNKQVSCLNCMLYHPLLT